MWTLAPLGPEHMLDFIRICHELWSQSDVLPHLGFDMASTRALGERCLNMPNYLCQMAFVDGHNIGCMVGYVTPLVFSNKIIGVEEGLYVRQGTQDRAAIAAEMLRRFVRFCEDAGAVDVRTGVINGAENYAADVFYRRNKFKRIGTIYALKQPLGGV